MILRMHGTAAYEAYVEDMRMKRAAEAIQLAKQQARRKARAMVLRNVCRRLKAIFGKASR